MAAMPKGAVAQLEKVAKFYARRLIFKNVSLQVREGDAFMLTGDNGAGKTTLLRLLSGLTRPDAGRIQFPGTVALLGHETCLYPNMTALENLEFWTSIAGRSYPKSALLDTLEEINLARFANLHCRYLSRGMAQRLNFARALLCRPALLLLDEPFTGMDAKSFAISGKMLQNRLANGTAMLMTSHDAARDAIFVKGRLHIKDKTLSVMTGCGEMESEAP